jgi:hypothetical protein
LRQSDLENAEEIQREHQHDDTHAEDEVRIRELHRPTDLATGAFDRDEQERERDEPDEDAGDEGEAAAQNAAAIMPRMLDEAEKLE